MQTRWLDRKTQDFKDAFLKVSLGSSCYKFKYVYFLLQQSHFNTVSYTNTSVCLQIYMYKESL